MEKINMKKDIIKEIGNYVKEFLKENGGMDNGYCTTVQGECDVTSEFSDLEFYTPQTEKLTFIEHKELCDDLTNEIVKILKKYKKEGAIFRSQCLGNGCSSISVDIIEMGGRIC